MIRIRTLIRRLALGAGLLATGPAAADVAVLVHGFLGSAASWETSGVATALDGAGWRRAGVLISGPAGAAIVGPPATTRAAQGGRATGCGPRPRDPARDREQARARTPLGERDARPCGGGLDRDRSAPADDHLYLSELPSQAPLGLQAGLLVQQLAWVALRHPDEPITLIGHSAGGVVARMALVAGGGGTVDRLITLAAPHLGTLHAVEAIDATSDGGPIGWIKSFFGGSLYHTVRDSHGLLIDLAPGLPGNALGWLNRQPHPEIDYLGVIKTLPGGLGDELVPSFSQDLNSVPALAGRAQRVTVASSHALGPADGLLLRALLTRQTVL